MAAPSHLFFVMHGLAGRPEDCACLRDMLLQSQPPVAVHLARANLDNTHDGVEAGARRLAAELLAVVRNTASLRRLSLVGNSLGGVYGRYLAALLFDADAGTVAGLQPVTFCSTATPHLGVGPWGHLGLVPAWMQSLAVLPLGRTVQELMVRDAHLHPSRSPLLARMASPAAELPFLPALAAFATRHAYCNAHNDLLVPYQTASLLPDAVVDVEHARNAPGVLFTRERPGAAAPAEAAVPVGDMGLRRRMAANLQALGWRETAVAFPGVLPLAHNRIVALRRDPLTSWLNARGEGVVADTAAALLAEAAAAAAGDAVAAA